MNTDPILKNTLEAALMAAGKPLTLEQLCDLFVSNRDDEALSASERKTLSKPVRVALQRLMEEYSDRGVELIEVASGFRFQVKPSVAPQVAHLWAERPSRYSRALLETLALVAYRQPITRTEIEKVRGVSVSTQIMKTLLDYNWVRVVGHRNTPGRPRIYGTTALFLDHFGLKNLKDLPPLAQLRDHALEEERQLREGAANEQLPMEIIAPSEPIPALTALPETQPDAAPAPAVLPLPVAMPPLLEVSDEPEAEGLDSLLSEAERAWLQVDDDSADEDDAAEDEDDDTWDTPFWEDDAEEKSTDTPLDEDDSELDDA